MDSDLLLIHGLGADQSIMADMSDFFRRYGFNCINVSYDSKASILDCAESVKDQLQAKRTGASNLYAVGHSLGGLILHVLVNDLLPDESWVRCVMLGPPSQGSCLAKSLSRFAWYRKRYGIAGVELGEFGQSLNPIKQPCGVIAGTRCLWRDRIVLGIMGWRGHDGKVMLTETQVKGMSDHLVLPVAHPTMPNQIGVMLQALHFFKQGCFAQGPWEPSDVS